ncbi:MAG: zinc-ribbon domain-containing protein, partial [Phascolarctobacterium sp.]|nr:zinc-ribbon domain-containing protein [Phascolarctobacterium sp.]
MGKLIQGVNDLETLYPEIAKEWHPTANGNLLPREVACRSNKKYFWLCSNGHIYETTADNRVCGSGCPYCGN